MSVFSELLNSHVKSKDVPVVALTRYIGMERSAFYKVLRGERVPQSRELIERLAEFIRLTPDESDELLRAWVIERIGAKDYYRRQSVNQFLEEFPFGGRSQNHTMKLHSTELTNEKGAIRHVTGKSEVEQCLMSVIMSEAQDSTGEIEMLLPPLPDVINMLSYIDQSVEELSIRHILSLDSENGQNHKDHTNYNLNCIRGILPLYTYSFRYEAFYYYGSRMEAQESMRLFPYMVATSRYAVLIGGDLKEALRIEDQSAILGLHQMFAGYLRKCNPIAKRIDDPVELMQNVQKRVSFPSKRNYSFQMVPCLTPFFTKDLIIKILDPAFLANPRFGQSLLQHIGLVGSVHDSAHFVEMFSEEGLRYILEHGRFTEYPKEIYTPVSTKDIIRLVRQAMQLSGKTYHYHMLKQSIGSVEFGANVFVNSSFGYILFTNPLDGKMIYLDILESSILQSFYDYLENMQADLFYTDEEMKERVEAILREYEETHA